MEITTEQIQLHKERKAAAMRAKHQMESRRSSGPVAQKAPDAAAPRRELSLSETMTDLLWASFDNMTHVMVEMGDVLTSHTEIMARIADSLEAIRGLLAERNKPEPTLFQDMMTAKMLYREFHGAIGLNRIYSLARDGVIPSSRVGRRVLFSRKALEALLKGEDVDVKERAVDG